MRASRAGAHRVHASATERGQLHEADPSIVRMAPALHQTLGLHGRDLTGDRRGVEADELGETVDAHRGLGGEGAGEHVARHGRARGTASSVDSCPPACGSASPARSPAAPAPRGRRRRAAAPAGAPCRPSCHRTLPTALAVCPTGYLYDTGFPTRSQPMNDARPTQLPDARPPALDHARHHPVGGADRRARRLGPERRDPDDPARLRHHPAEAAVGDHRLQPHVRGAAHHRRAPRRHPRAAQDLHGRRRRCSQSAPSSPHCRRAW